MTVGSVGFVASSKPTRNGPAGTETGAFLLGFVFLRQFSEFCLLLVEAG